METSNDIHSTYADTHVVHEIPKGNYLFVLALGALGVVYGDIGTSPLYSLRECFHGSHAIVATPENILGVLSLIFWSLIIVVTIKYLVFVLRADNQGEGGILSLAALATPITPSGNTEKWIIIVLGTFGASLLYGDGVITPSISVLSAVEGISIATPQLSKFVVPLTIVILIGLFFIQKRGTAGIGKVFGPIMVLWFLTLAILGIAQIFHYPQVFNAINPYNAFEFFILNGWHGFLILGSVFLVMTGAEALYADMGHFGKKPIRLAWFVLVLPALLLNYFGQGALLLENPAMAENPFYNLVPSWALYPMIVLATAAAVIASQALISGAFSLTMQAVQLGLIPRLKITHTSQQQFGQIYLPAVNWALMCGCIFTVIGFQTSSRLAGAYGIAVSSAMVITTLIFFVVTRQHWNWGYIPTLLLCGTLLLIDLAFFGSNLMKFLDGGWFPFLLGATIFTVMMTWKKGRSILTERVKTESDILEHFLEKVDRQKVTHVPGTAIFMNSNATRTPQALLKNLNHNKVLHDKNIFLTVKTRQIPYVDAEERIKYEPLGNGFSRVKFYYGYMEDPNIPRELANIDYPGFVFKPNETTYFLGRETIISTKRYSGMAIWREKLFGLLSRNARSATSYFSIPANRVVELGEQIEI